MGNLMLALELSDLLAVSVKSAKTVKSGLLSAKLGFTSVKLIGYNLVNSNRIETLFSTKLP
jgi:hypothetical protein